MVVKGLATSRHGRKSHIWVCEPSLWSWPSRCQASPLPWHSGPWWCITIPSLVTNVLAVQNISPGQTFFDFFFSTFTVTLTLTAVISFCTTLWFMIMYMYHQPGLVAKHPHFIKYSRNSHILTVLALAVTLALKINQSICMTFRLMMMHHHTN